MFSEHNKLFTIGQFSAIHGVTKKTLMWYDEIGLLKPAVIGENGYRYYTYFQSPTLEIILMLRELNPDLFVQPFCGEYGTVIARKNNRVK